MIKRNRQFFREMPWHILFAGLALACGRLWAGEPAPVVQAGTGGSPPSWQAHIGQLAADPAVVRLYSFQEGAGDLVANAATGGEGALVLLTLSPYGLYRGFPRWPVPAAEDCPRWTKGRWPGKSAVEFGGAQRQAVRSRFYGTPHGVFTVEAWVRAHELEEEEWAGGDVLALGMGYKSGWRIYVERRHWCRDGFACFRLGTTDGVAATPFGEPAFFPFGVWHHLVAVWDGRQVRLYIDGKVSITATTGPFTPPAAPPKNADDDTGGLTVGGGLRFDLDELVIYDRALAAEDVAAHFQRFAPAESATDQRQQHRRDKAVRRDLARIEFRFPRDTGGYFPVGRALTATARVPVATDGVLAGVRSAAFVVRSREGGAPLQTDEKALAAGADATAVSAEFPYTPTRCGLYTVGMSVKDAAGVAVRQETFPIGVVLTGAGERESSTTTSTNASTETGTGRGTGRGGDEFILGVHQGLAPLPGARATGATWARVVIDWSRIEPQKGIYAWTEADQMVECAAQQKLHILGCVTGWPWRLLEADKSQVRPPAEMTAYRSILRLIAQRYRRQIEAWEIWDAPAGPPRFMFRDNRGAEAYSTLAKAAAEVLRQEAPGTLILGAGVPIDAPYAGNWVERVLAGDAKDALDGVVMQSAPPVPAASVLKSLPADKGALLRRWNTAAGYFQPAERMGALDPADFAGLFAGRTVEAGGVTGVRSWPYVLFSARDSAIFQVRQLLLERAGGTAAVFLASGAEEYYPAWNASDGAPSEKGVALAAMSAMLAGARFVDQTSVAPIPQLRILHFERAGQGTPAVGVHASVCPGGQGSVWVALSSGTPSRLSVQVSGQGVQAWDWLGNPLATVAAGGNGTFDTVLDGAPLYLVAPVQPQIALPAAK